MPFVFEQPNLGNPDENHLYFDPGDGRRIAYRLRDKHPEVTGPTLVFLPGYMSDMDGTTSAGTYGGQASVDPNSPVYGVSQFQIEHNIKEYCGVSAKVKLVERLAQENEYPLRLSIEPEEV